MPKIDQLDDATYGHPRMSFLDAFQGYHQITLAVEDQEKMTFISPDTNYHYTVIPFGLKNARTTYQRMMTRMFRDMIGHMVEVYIDDMVVKSKQKAQHIEDLRGVFEVLWQHKLRLNANKCAFGMGAGKPRISNHQSGDRSQPQPDRSRKTPQAIEQSERRVSVDRNVSCS